MTPSPSSQEEARKLKAARRLAEEFAADFTPTNGSLVDTIEEAFEWLQDRTVNPTPDLSDVEELVRPLAEWKDRLLAKADKTAAEVQFAFDLSQAIVALRAALKAKG